MLAYILRRLAYLVPVVFGVAVITFLLFNVVGGDPSYEFLGKNASPEELQNIRRQLGFDKPVFLDLDHWWNRWYSPRAATALAGMDRELEPLDRLDGLPPEEYFRRSVSHEIVLAGYQRQLVAMEKFAVPPLVTAILEAPRVSLQARASRLVQQILFVDKAIRPEDPPERVAKKVAWWREWWDAHRAEYRFPRSFRGTLFSLADSQFTFYLRQIVTCDFGPSFVKNKKISELIAEGIGPSLSLALPSFLFGILVAIAVSLVSACWRNTWIDRVIVVLTVMGMSVSLLVYIIAAQYFLAFKRGWFPIQGYEPGWRAVAFLTLPGLIWVIASLGSDVRLFRTILLDETGQDYVRTALAKGVTRWSLLFQHILKNAMIPILTRLVISLPFLYTGSLLLENFFGIPGLGSLSIEALSTSDFPVIKAMVFLGSVLFVLGNLLTDLCYALVDPRVKLE